MNIVQTSGAKQLLKQNKKYGGVLRHSVKYAQVIGQKRKKWII
jgi:hypothetical protein